MASVISTELPYNSNATEVPLDGMQCSLFNGNQHQCDVIIIVRRVMASLSFIGCLFMISVIWLFRKYMILSQRLILYLSIAALCDSVSYLMGDLHPDGSLCDFKAFLITYCDWSVLLWVCCITVNLYVNAIRLTHTDRLEWVYHVTCWLFPLVISSLPFIGNHYGPAGQWCWIVDNWRWRFGIWYAPLFVIIAALFFTYLYIIIMVNRQVKTWEGTYDPDVERKKRLLKEDVKPLKGYPFVYLAVSIFPLIHRIQNALSSDAVFALVLLHVISSPLQGALNCIVFGMDKDTMSKLTPSQLKIAIDSRRNRSDTLIREYPAQTEAQTEAVEA